VIQIFQLILNFLNLKYLSQQCQNLNHHQLTPILLPILEKEIQEMEKDPKTLINNA
jgi:hypothetical protein